MDPGTLLVTRAPRLRSCWHPVAFSSALRGAPLARRLLGEDVVVWRAPDGSVRAALDRCPHRWAPLSAGWIDGDGRLTCPYHGWSFAPDGGPARVPQLDDPARAPTTYRLTTLPAVERLGMVWTSLVAEPAPTIAEVPELDDPAYRRVEIGVIRYGAAAPAIVDNNTDAAHVAWVHTGTFGRDQDPRVPVGRVERTAFGVEITAGDMGVAESPGAAAPGARRTATQMWLPFTQVSRLAYSDGSVHVLLKGLCPVDDRTTDVHLAVVRREAPGAPPADDARVRAFELAIEHEDRSMLERLPAAFALDPGLQAHLPHDRAGVAYRRALADLLGDRPAAP